VEALSEVLFVEYSGRAERDQLQLDDLSFPDPRKNFDAEAAPLGLRAFGLRRGLNPRAEQSWVVPKSLAAMINVLDRSDESRLSPKNQTPEDARAKRVKVFKHFEELMRHSRSTVTSRKLCALQALPFLIAERDMGSEEFSSVLLDLFDACSGDSSVVSSWAMLSVARWDSCKFLHILRSFCIIPCLVAWDRNIIAPV
jgi:ataxia telangiectasia mutated family protein